MKEYKDCFAEKEKKYYVYALIDPLKNVPFYIGKGTNNRIRDHFKGFEQDTESNIEFIEDIEDNEMQMMNEDTTESEKRQRLSELFSIGYEFTDIARIIAVNLSEESAFAIETLLIKTVYGFDNLTNQVHGHYKENYREYKDWSLTEGLDYVHSGSKKRTSREPLLKKMLLYQYDKPLIEIAQKINWITFDPLKIHDSGELGIEGDYKGTRIKIAIKNQLYAEIRPRGKAQEEWMYKHFKMLGLATYLRGDFVFYPRLGRGKNRIKLSTDDVVKRVKLLKNILDAESYDDLSLETLKLVVGQSKVDFADKRRIDAYIFSEKWIRMFKGPLSNSIEIEKDFGDECFKLQFEMDSGHRLQTMYPEYNAMASLRGLKTVMLDINDIELLGTALFSKWREITHWSQENILSEENREWFISALSRLKELSKR